MQKYKNNDDCPNETGKMSSKNPYSLVSHRYVAKKTYLCKTARHHPKAAKQLMLNNIKHILPVFFCFIAYLSPFFNPLNGQQRVENGIAFIYADPESIEFEFFVTDYHFQQLDESTLQIVAPSCNSHSHESGKPQLPQFTRLVTIPNGCTATVTLSDAQWFFTALPSHGHLAAATDAQPKTDEWRPSSPDRACYTADRYYQLPLAELTLLGEMRGAQTAKLTISPFIYNPVQREIGICQKVTVKIQFTRPNKPLPTKASDWNPHSFFQPASKSFSNSLTSNSPATYLIVSPQRFHDNLQPLISWKRQEGYLVESFIIETTNRDIIRTELERRYHTANPLHPAPLYILLVGESDDIPPFVAQHRISGLESHRTDLYYGEFTGDYLPDAIVGRLSIRDTTQLRHIIDKTLAYEQFTLPDSSYLNRSLLVAGKELTHPAPMVTNGQVNYLKTLLSLRDTNHDTLCFYNPASDSLADDIYAQLRSGVGLVNYTSHCTYWGWIRPMLGINHVDSLDENNKLFVSINNCCRANEIIIDCFGEHLLRKPHAGAVAVIGATNETLWEEDYYWSVGEQDSLTFFPQYNGNNPGAFDHLFHSHQESYNQQALTVGQMLHAGNWAVSQSGSPFDAFYWEIYSLLGDPSLMPYIGIPEVQQLQVDNITAGDNQITLHGNAYARVAATRNDTLLGVCTLDADGEGVISCTRPLLDSMLLTSTAQFHRPLQRVMGVSPCATPRIVIADRRLFDPEGVPVSHLTLCDSARLSMTLRNVGESVAQGGLMTLFFDDVFASTPLTFSVGPLSPQQDTVIDLWLYPLTYSGNGVATLDASLTNDSSQWSQQLCYDLYAAQLEITSSQLFLGDSVVNAVSPLTDYTLQLKIVNNGRGRALDATLYSSNQHETVPLGTINAGGTITCRIPVSTDNESDSLVVDLLLSHRTDSVPYSYSFPFDSTLDIPHTETEAHFSIFPNPASERVLFSGFTEPTHIVIYDNMGRSIKDFFAQKEEVIQYSTLSLRCGCYSVLFQDSHHRVVQKMIVVR